MAVKIGIASGKGGTGKTTLAINLLHYCKNSGSKVQLVDCDVEEPNDAIFFSGAIPYRQEEIFRLIPQIDTQKCSFCRKCVEYCEFNAIVVIPVVRFAEANSSLCHSCGACIAACNENAISEIPETIGQITYYELSGNSGLIEGRLKIGSAMQTMLIKELKKRIPDNNDVLIYDAPPGTSCPVVETIADMDYIVLVTEPTPFGLHDLKLMVELLSDINKPYGVVVNKAGLGSKDVFQYLEKEKIRLLGEIPFNKDYASAYATGDLFANCPSEIADSYAQIANKILHTKLRHERNNHP